MNLINKRNQVLLPLSFFDRKDKRWKNLKLRLFQIGDHAHRCQNKTRKNLSNFFRLTLENPDIVRTFRLVRTTLDLNWTRGSVTVPVPELQRTHLSAWPAGDFPVGSLHHVTPRLIAEEWGGAGGGGAGAGPARARRSVTSAPQVTFVTSSSSSLRLCARGSLGSARRGTRTEPGQGGHWPGADPVMLGTVKMEGHEAPDWTGYYSEEVGTARARRTTGPSRDHRTLRKREEVYLKKIKREKTKTASQTLKFLFNRSEPNLQKRIIKI